jgi:hypothetical protein
MTKMTAAQAKALGTRLGAERVAADLRQLGAAQIVAKLEPGYTGLLWGETARNEAVDRAENVPEQQRQAFLRAYGMGARTAAEDVRKRWLQSTHVEEIDLQAMEDAELRREVERSGGEVPVIYRITQGHRRVEFIWFHALGTIGVGTQTRLFGGRGGVVWIYVAPLPRVSGARAALPDVVSQVLERNASEERCAGCEHPMDGQHGVAYNGPPRRVYHAECDPARAPRHG